MSQESEQGVAAVSTADVWKFGSATLDESSLELRIGDRLVTLERKPKQVLLSLLQNAPGLVRKDDLVSQAWPGRVISDSALTSCVARLRSALKHAQDVEIKTEHGLGYRLLASTVEVERESTGAFGAPGDHSAAANNMGGIGWLRVTAAFGAMALAIVGAWFFASNSVVPPAQASVAVLPFANLSPAPETNAYMAHGLHDNVLTQLAQLDQLKVISRTSVLRFEDTQRAIPGIAQELGVSHVLEGSFQQDGDRVRVIAQLINAAQDDHIWAQTYDRPAADLMTLQSEIAYEVARAIGMRLAPDEAKRLQAAQPRPPAAQNAYWEALALWQADGTSAEPLFTARSLLQRAVSEDPGFAQAWALLSRVHSMLHWFGHDASDERVQLAKAAADKALELDDGLAEAHVAIGLYRSAGFKDYAGSAQAYRHAVALQPSSAEAHFFLGSALRRQRDYKDAIHHFDKAIELDPLNALYLSDLGEFYAGLRMPAKAKPLYDQIMALDSASFFPQLTRAYFYAVQLGDYEVLRDLLESDAAGEHAVMQRYASHHLAYYEQRYGDAIDHLAAMPGPWMPPSGGSARTPKALSMGLLARMDGREDDAKRYYESGLQQSRQELEAHPEDPTALMNMADAHAGLGQHEAARTHANRAIALTPRDRDPVVHCLTTYHAAVLHLRIGDVDAGLELFRSIMDLPHSPNTWGLDLYPNLQALADDPRVKRLYQLASKPVVDL